MNICEWFTSKFTSRKSRSQLEADFEHALALERARYDREATRASMLYSKYNEAKAGENKLFAVNAGLMREAEKLGEENAQLRFRLTRISRAADTSRT